MWLEHPLRSRLPSVYFSCQVILALKMVFADLLYCDRQQSVQKSISRNKNIPWHSKTIVGEKLQNMMFLFLE